MAVMEELLAGKRKRGRESTDKEGDEEQRNEHNHEQKKDEKNKEQERNKKDDVQRQERKESGEHGDATRQQTRYLKFSTGKKRGRRRRMMARKRGTVIRSRNLSRWGHRRRISARVQRSMLKGQRSQKKREAE
ncbi:hypothetical protein KEM55_002337 [Ascosphaera atra]|nr:hypothetical protein KEM55_002337 [Ascosphaera atra]